MTRQDLYQLVWQSPMTTLAKTFGLSDVGLRKVCVKFNIPTPPIGYWAKRAHGKPVRQPPLPPQKSNVPETIDLVARDTAPLPAEIVQEQESILARDAGFPPVVVPMERPANLHKVALMTARSLKAGRADYIGMTTAVLPGGIAVSVGSGSFDRVVRIVDAVARAAEVRGYRFEEHKEGIRIVVDDVPIAWRIHETKAKTPHTPTERDLKAEAKREEDRKRYPSLYSSDSNRKAYGAWDHSPSGRLSMTFSDATKFYWGSAGQIGNWRDRSGAPLETYLDEAVRELALGAARIKRRLAEEAEQERVREAERELWRREQARRARAAKRQAYLLRKAEDFDRHRKLSAFADYMEREVGAYNSEAPVDRLVGELRALVDTLGEGLGRDGLVQEVDGLGLYDADDNDPALPRDED
jgi:hypothetical protein